MSYTYDPDTAIGQVRELIGDTDFTTDAGIKPDGTNFTDDQVSNALAATGNNIELAAARLCDTLARMWLAYSSTITIGRYKIDPSQQAAQYREMARQLRGSRFVLEVY